MIKVFIADDHQSYIEGINAYFKGNSEISIVGTANNGKEVIEKINSVNPDVLLLDIDMPIMNGEDTLRVVKRDYPHIKVLILTSLNDKSIVDSLKKDGAEGFRNKDASISDIIQVIKRINEGYIDYLSRSIKNHNKITISYNSVHLTTQEKMVVSHLSNGLTSKAIAEKMHLSEHTIESHIKTARIKTDSKNSTELVAIAIKNNLI
jgi:two-component system, NarL family, nitrate/nitrite response regulator NarL